jgi:phage-related protein
MKDEPEGRNEEDISCTDPDTIDDFIIDCERQDIYMADTRVNKNNLFTLSDGEFFELKPGRNTIHFTGIAPSIYITPNWWTV